MSAPKPPSAGWTLPSVHTLPLATSPYGKDGFDRGPGKIVCAGNLFILNAVSLNAVNGIEMDSCTNNSFVTNSSTTNGQHGFSLDGSHRSYFSRNRADQNHDTGFHVVRTNNENVFANNSAAANVVRDADQSTDSFCNLFQNNTFGIVLRIATIADPTPNAMCP